MRRLIFSLICSSSKAADLLKPTSLGMSLLVTGPINVAPIYAPSHS
jgi:hypothetical protein